MNESNSPNAAGTTTDRQGFLSTMFASMVIQQTNMASIFLGLAPNPQTGETACELDNARYFIDQLEMIEAKTKGNLNKQEEGLLKQSLTGLRLAFVEVSGKQAGAVRSEATTSISTPNPPQIKAEPDASGVADRGSSEAPAAADSPKKFTKTY